MHKKIGVVAGFLMMALPAIAAADVQSQIASILAQISSIQSQLSVSQWTSPGALTAQAGGTTPPKGNCVDLTRDLYRPLNDAATGGEVTKLQKFLVAEKVLAPGTPTSNVTGNFGQLTEEAVQKWQYDHDIVRTGNAETTGYGYVGKRSRAIMSCGGTGTGGGSGAGGDRGGAPRGDANFKAIPFQGPAPLAVGFFALKATSASEFSIDFGDGTSASTLSPATCAPGSTSCGYATNHTYTANGTYTAKLKKKDTGPALSGCDSEYCRVILGIANSSVSDVVAQATITVGPRASSTRTTVPPTRTGVASTTESTSSGLSAREQIQLLYFGFLGRSGDAAGIEYWVNQVKNGLSIIQVAQSIGLSDESQTRNPYLKYPASSDPEQFIEAIYQRLFSRPADAEGKAYWVASLKSRGTSSNNGAAARIVLEIISGASVSPADLKTMLSKIPGADTNRDTTTGSVKTSSILMKFTGGGNLRGEASFNSNDCSAGGFKIDWGDSKSDTTGPNEVQCPNGPTGTTMNGGAPISFTIDHTYTNVGTYIVKLFKGNSTTPLSSTVFIATR